jgi:hypothetical protein
MLYLLFGDKMQLLERREGELLYKLVALVSLSALLLSLFAQTSDYIMS